MLTQYNMVPLLFQDLTRGAGLRENGPNGCPRRHIRENRGGRIHQRRRQRMRSRSSGAMRKLPRTSLACRRRRQTDRVHQRQETGP